MRIEPEFHKSINDELRAFLASLGAKEPIFSNPELWVSLRLEDRIIAAAIYERNDPMTYYLHFIGVEEKYRLNKVGHYLLGFSCVYLKTHGAAEIITDVPVPLLDFFIAEGFLDVSAGQCEVKNGHYTIRHKKDFRKLLIK